MIRYGMILFLCILFAGGCLQKNKKSELEVTYIANEGFMVSMGSTKVLIDALHASKYYANPSDTLADRMMNGIPPFDKVDYVLVTHAHADHFNAEMMSRFLLHHPAARLIASSEVCSQLNGDSIGGRGRSGIDLVMGQHQIIHGDGAELIALRLKHGGGAEVSNLAFVVRSNGFTFVHVGDASLVYNEEYLRTVDWKSYNVDLLFIEYFDHSSETQEIIEKMIKPKYVVLMHIPVGEEESVRNADEKVHPRTVVFGKENETRRFDTIVDDEASR